jgi:glycosyltransferase involved in cell wall biosynthesis
MLVRGPTPVLPVLAQVWQKPLALLLVADATIGLENLPQPRWRKSLIRTYATWYQRQQDSIAKRSLTFVNSRLLYQKYEQQVPNLIETQTTTLRMNDFFDRTDTCKEVPYRLLYTGRMSRMKGLCEMVKALSLLINDGFDVVLDLVGMVEANDPILDEIAQLALSLGVEKCVQFHGYKPAGAELLAYYRRADIYIIASQASSEGFPRTIWEAMASSVPVIATTVGSIPSYISDTALLVPPKDPVALAQCVKKLLTNPMLRQILIQKGMQLARLNTLERRSEEMTAHIQKWIRASC